MKWLLSVTLTASTMTASIGIVEQVASQGFQTPVVYLESSNKSHPMLSQEWIAQQEQIDIEQQAKRDAEAKAEAERLKQEAMARQAKLNTELLEARVTELGNYVGKTRYVFSGSTPKGWDCSGLVVWFYRDLGVELEHSANKQGNSGTKVKTPKIGDIVVFGYKGSKSYYHSSIYIGDGKVIHAGFRKGTSTEVIALDSPSFKNSTITFIRHIESN